MATLTPQEQLAAAQAALHDLLLGQSARVFVDQNGERVEYTPANRGALQAYVQQLKMEVAGVSSAVTPLGPMGVYF